MNITNRFLCSSVGTSYFFQQVKVSEESNDCRYPVECFAPAGPKEGCEQILTVDQQCPLQVPVSRVLFPRGF